MRMRDPGPERMRQAHVMARILMLDASMNVFYVTESASRKRFPFAYDPWVAG
jgi:hypothetical protein